jgi:uncharacterized protein (TIGR04255 family)
MTHYEYETNFIKTVVFRIDFSPIMKLTTEIPVDFQDKIRDELPKFKEEKIYEFINFLSKDPNTDEPIHIQDKKIWPQFVFLSKEELKKVSLVYNYLAIEFIEYSTYNDFSKCIEKIYSIFRETYKTLDITRLGLRYINNIEIKEGNPLDWENLINPILTHTINEFSDKEDNIFKNDISRSLSQITFKKDEYSLGFRYGIYNSAFPSKIAKKEFILDFDCYTQDVNEQNVIELTRSFNEIIRNFFELCIEDGLREIMGVKK